MPTNCGPDEGHKPKLMPLEGERRIVSLTYALRPSCALNSFSGQDTKGNEQSMQATKQSEASESSLTNIRKLCALCFFHCTAQ